MEAWRFKVLFACLLFTFPSLGDCAQSCVSALLALQSELGESGYSDTYDGARGQEVPTVEVTATLPGVHGGQKLAVRRLGPTWGSYHTTVEYDPQGDPRWFIETLGKDAARFFGFEILSSEEMIVPDHKEFTEALRKVNAELRARGQEDISIRFYRADIHNVNVGKYNMAFIRSGGLPIAESGNHFFHDISFHTAAIYLPNDLVRYAQRRADFVMDFVAFMRAKYDQASPEIAAAAKYYGFLLKLNLTTDIDNATGVISVGLVNYLKADGTTRGDPDNFIDYIVFRFAGGAASYRGEYYGNPQSPRATLVDAIDDNLYHGRYYDAASEKGKLKVHNRVLPPRKIKEDLKEFVALYQSPDPSFDPRKPFHTSVKKACLDLTLKREAVRAAVLHLLNR